MRLMDRLSLTLALTFTLLSTTAVLADESRAQSHLGISHPAENFVLEPAPFHPEPWRDDLPVDFGGHLLTGTLDPAAVLDKAGAVNLQSRSSVVAHYETLYEPAFSVPHGFTGDVDTCNSGSTSAAYVDATFDVLNFFRTMAGLAPVVNTTSYNPGCQDAATMMSAAGALDHSPSPSWPCYTADGDTAAGASNLALGTAGPSAMAGYVQDPGSFNVDVGHRRWILHPPRLGMGTGSVVEAGEWSANALWVFGSTQARPATTIVSWPPPGFVPYQVVFPRWSFSLNTAPSASYASATVTLRENGVAVPTTVVSDSVTFYGDNTIVFEPSGLFYSPGMADRTFEVTVSGIQGAPQSTYVYEVTVIDPAVDTGEIFADGFESGTLDFWN